jgi:hypothetical protein
MFNDSETGDNFAAEIDAVSDDDTRDDHCMQSGGEGLGSDDDSLVKILRIPPPTAGIHELRKVIIFPSMISSV